MNALLAALPFNANWFDVVWAVALIFGMWSGVRVGLLGEFIRLVSWILMIVLSVKYYDRVGDWLQPKTGWEPEMCRLMAFVGIVAGIYLVSLLLRYWLRKAMLKSKSAAFMENFGGLVLGVVRMSLVMVFLTLWLAMVRSPFWQKHVAKESVFGSAVVNAVPTVAELSKKQWKETVPFFRDLERPIDADDNDLEPNKYLKAKPTKK